MMRRLLLILCLCLSCIGLRAQTVDRLPLAKCAYLYFASGQGEALYAMLSDEMQAALPATALSGMFGQLTAQFGALQSTGDWHRVEAEGMTVCFCDLAFEKYTLRFQTAFDGAGRIAGLFVKPAPKPVSAPVSPPDSLAMVERDTVVTCDGFRLPATLCLPRRAVEQGSRVPCVVLVHGSGPHDRNETIGPNRPFRDLAWGLAGRGIATLRYDKRTYVYKGYSVPEGRQLDLDVETADDAVAAVALAQSLPGVDADSVYLLGHSQGGMLAPRIAARASRLAGVILLAAPARPLEDLLLEQVTYLNSLAPSEKGRRQVADLQRRVENVKRLGTSAFCDTIPFPFDAPRSYWADIIACRPVEDAARLTLPLLVLQAERDYQVTMQDFALWRAALLKRRNASFKSYPKLNHLLQEGTGKATPDEYQQPSSVPAYVLDDLARFVRTGQL